MNAVTKPAFCASCIEELELTRCIRRGRTVWLCDGCRDPIGQLRQHAESSEAGLTLADGCRQKRSGIGR